jgi:hypothetical protein
MRWGSRGLCSFTAACAAVVAFALSASAQSQYPPPTPTRTPNPTKSPKPSDTPKPTKKPKNCATTGTTKNGKFSATDEFKRGQRIVIKGEKECAGVSKPVSATFEDNGAKKKIGATTSSRKGAYGVQGNIPASASFGDHTVLVKSGSKSYTAVVEVVAATGSTSSGSDLAAPVLAAWVALAGVATAFFLGSRRRRRPMAAVAVPDVGVPTIDTSGFVPSYSNRHAVRKTAKGAASRQTAAKAPKTNAAPRKPAAAKKTPAKPKADAAPAAASKGAAPKPRGKATTDRKEPKAPRRQAPSATPAPPRDPQKDDPEA